MALLTRLWMRFWMRQAGHSHWGRLATFWATLPAAPYYGRRRLAKITPKGFISPFATISHDDLKLHKHVLIDDRVLIYQDQDGGSVILRENVCIYRDTIIQTGQGGSVTIGANTAVQPRCQFSAYLSPIEIGEGVQIAPNCAFYPYDHGMVAGELIGKQALRSTGGITVEDDAWLGLGVIILAGVRVGHGAVVGAGAVVTRDVPDGAIAIGVPAKVVKYRTEGFNA